MGRGTWDVGRGTWDVGRGAWDVGRGRMRLWMCVNLFLRGALVLCCLLNVWITLLSCV